MASKDLTYLSVDGPFSIYDKRKKDEKEPISSLEEYKRSVLKAIEGYSKKQKKPVRWNFLKNNQGLFKLSQSIDPFYTAMDTIQKATTGKSIYDQAILPGDDKPINKMISERDYIDGFSDIANGIESGKHAFSTSLGELLFMGTDFLADTDFNSAFQKYAKDIEPDKPETWRGDLAKLMTQFGVPGGFVAKILTRATKAAPIVAARAKMGTSKASKIAQRVIGGMAVVGVTDFVASPDQREEGTFFDFAKPTDTSNLSGRKKAVAMFFNRLKYGAEGTIVGGLFPIGGKAIQQTYKYGVKPISKPILRTTFNTAGGALKLGASGIRQNVDLYKYLLTGNPLIQSKISKQLMGASKYKIKKLISPLTRKFAGKGLPPRDQWRLFQTTSPNRMERTLARTDTVLSWFRSYGKIPKDIEGVSEAVQLFITKRARKFDKLLESVENRAHDLAKKFEARHNTNLTSKMLEKQYLDEVVDYLRGAKKLNGLEKEFRPLAFALKQDINKTLTEFGKNLPKGSKNEAIQNLKDSLSGRVDNYIIKSFATFTNPNYTPDPLVRKNAKNFILKNVVLKNRDLREIAKETYGGNSYLEKYSDDLIDNIIAKGRTANLHPIKILQNIGSKEMRMDKFKFLKTGEELPDAIKKLLGEEKDLRAQVMFTVSDAYASTATKQGFDIMAKIGRNNGWLFDNIDAAKTKFVNPVKIGKIDRLNSMSSDIEKMYTSPELANIFQKTGTPLDGLTKIPVIRQMLQAKAGVQGMKTLYSPQTQVRNVTSASFFALWNGHVGKSASALDSMRSVFKDIFKAGRGDPINEVEFAKYVEKLVGLGVYDENIVAAELRAVVNKLKDGKIKNENELFDIFANSKITEKVARLYAGGDNLWKGYGFEFFKSDLSVALKSVKDVEDYFKLHRGVFEKKNIFTGVAKSLDEALDDAAAFMLRNTYPTYSKVPPSIQALRNIPIIGNFVSFPSEMLRTGATSIRMSLKNIRSGNPHLAEMGYKNLIGGYLAVQGIGKAASATANYLTGATAEQWEAYIRSGAAPWDQNSNLVGIKKWENGESAAINFSYFSPYDVLERPIQAALTMANKQEIAEEDMDDYVLNLMFRDDGPVMELLKPFLSPAIYYERIQDVNSSNFLTAGRGGRTGDGNYIYSPTDSLEDKFNKSLVHIIKGAEPGILSTGGKIKDAIQGDVTGKGKLANLGDELMALFTGTRIIRIDVKDDLKFIAADSNRLLRAADETEKFYKSKNYINRPPSIMVDEFEKMQEEAFKIQRDLYMKIKDFQMLDLDEDTIAQILKKAGTNPKLVRNIMEGIFTPIPYSKPRFKSKVETLEKIADKKTENSKNFLYSLDEDFVFPKDELDEVIEDLQDKELFPNGYEPAEANAMKDAKGRLIYDERGTIKTKPTFLDKVVPKIKNLAVPGSPFSKAPTPQLETPNVDATRVVSNIDVLPTGLTASENAYLSEEEKSMKLKSRGKV
jgi:hypothetical protein